MSKQQLVNHRYNIPELTSRSISVHLHFYLYAPFIERIGNLAAKALASLLFGSLRPALRLLRQ